MDLSADHILIVFLLTTLAGLATGIGGFIAFFMKRTDTKALTFALGLSGGVMVYISLVELLGEAQHRLMEFEGHTAGSWIAIASFFGGIAVAALIDYLVPEDENPHEARGPEDIHGQASGEFSSSRIKRSGILFALAIGIHNFPEGIATFAAGLDSLTLGTSIALAGAFFYRPPAGDARTGAGIGQAFILDQIAFLPGNAEIHFIGNHPVDQRGQIPGRDGGSQTVDGVTSRETVHFRSGGRFLECLDQCMFTSTFSNNGYFHTPPVCRDGLILPS